MGEYILVNDVHLSDRPPSMCTDTYLDDLFTLLGEAADIAAERSGSIILAGDIFHHKTPSRTSHATVMRLIDWARSTPAPVYAVLGNHDLQHDRVASIDESQPLGVVIRSGAIELLDGWMSNGGMNTGALVFGLPWQMVWDDTTVWDGLQLFRELVIRYPDQHALVVTHAPLYPPGQELKFEFYPAQNWATAMDNRGTVHYGHVHHPHGVYEVDGVTFSNCGALSRGSLSEHNLTRTPSVAVWNSDTGLTEHIKLLSAKPADEVFRLVEAQATKTAGLNLSTFLESVQATQLDITSTDVVMGHITDMGLDPALIKVISTLLDEAGR